MKLLLVGHDIGSHVEEGHRIYSTGIYKALLRYIMNSGHNEVEVYLYNIPTVEGNVLSIPIQRNLAHTLMDFIQYVYKSKPDIIHLLNVPKELYAPIIKLLLRNKSVIIGHFFNSYSAFLKYGRYKIRYYTGAGGLTPFVTSASLLASIYLNKIASTYSLPIKAWNIPYPIDCQEFAWKDRSKRIILPNCEYLIAYIGQPIPSRGIDVAIEAFRRIARVEENACLLLLFPRSIYYDIPQHVMAVTKKIRRYHLQNKVILKFTSRHEMLRLVSQSDVVLLPFKQEYVQTIPPMILLELMGMGKPVVVYDVPEVLDYVRVFSKDCLARVHCEDIDGMVLQTLKLLHDSDERKLLGEKAKSFIEFYNNPYRVAKELVKVYFGVLNGKQD